MNYKLYIKSDPALFLIELADYIQGSSIYHIKKTIYNHSTTLLYTKDQFELWRKQLQQNELNQELFIKNQSLLPSYGRNIYQNKQLINPLKLLLILEQILPDHAIIIVDGGDFCSTASYILRARKPLSWLDPGAYGTLGIGAGFAIAAKLANPNSEIWIIYGDGSVGYSIKEYDTFLRHNIPIISLIGNDSCWSQIERDQKVIFNSDVACNLNYCDYHLIAQGYGAIGLKVDSNDQIKETIEQARNLYYQTNKPICINALIGKSNFREGSISV